MSQTVKQVVEMPKDIYESMLKVFVKMAMEKKDRRKNSVVDKSQNRKPPLNIR